MQSRTVSSASTILGYDRQRTAVLIESLIVGRMAFIVVVNPGVSSTTVYFFLVSETKMAQTGSSAGACNRNFRKGKCRPIRISKHTQTYVQKYWR